MNLESSFLPLVSSLPPTLDHHSRVSSVVIPAKAGAPFPYPRARAANARHPKSFTLHFTV